MRHIIRVIAALLAVLLLAAPCMAASALIPGGETVGLEIALSSLCITKIEDGTPAEEAGLRVGDCILSVNQVRIDSVQELAAVISAGKPLIVGIERKEKAMSFTVYPRVTESGWKIGAEVMERVSGIGTVTYIDTENNVFGALGHGVNVPGSAELLPVSGGAVFSADIFEVEKSEQGAPGELKGSFSEQAIGYVTKNTPYGLFGSFNSKFVDTQSIPVAETAQIHAGDATIRCCVSGTEVREYSVQILEIYPSAKSGRDLLLEITDRELLTQTGGIVRGMSGSPIIQDGRIVGAVTHVIVDNPTKGYGIFIEKMLDAAS